MTKSKLFRLNLRDLLRGLSIALVTAVLGALQTILSTGTPFTWSSIYTPAALALVSYLLANLVTNSNGGVFDPDPTEENQDPSRP
jgi:hypothetical protein